MVLLHRESNIQELGDDLSEADMEALAATVTKMAELTKRFQRMEESFRLQADQNRSRWDRIMEKLENMLGITSSPEPPQPKSPIEFPSLPDPAHTVIKPSAKVSVDDVLDSDSDRDGVLVRQDDIQEVRPEVMSFVIPLSFSSCLLPTKNSNVEIDKVAVQSSVSVPNSYLNLCTEGVRQNANEKMSVYVPPAKPPDELVCSVNMLILVCASNEGEVSLKESQVDLSRIHIVTTHQDTIIWAEKPPSFPPDLAEIFVASYHKEFCQEIIAKDSMEVWCTLVSGDGAIFKIRMFQHVKLGYPRMLMKPLFDSNCALGDVLRLCVLMGIRVQSTPYEILCLDMYCLLEFVQRLAESKFGIAHPISSKNKWVSAEDMYLLIESGDSYQVRDDSLLLSDFSRKLFSRDIFPQTDRGDSWRYLLILTKNQWLVNIVVFEKAMLRLQFSVSHRTHGELPSREKCAPLHYNIPCCPFMELLLFVDGSWKSSFLLLQYRYYLAWENDNCSIEHGKLLTQKRLHDQVLCSYKDDHLVWVSWCSCNRVKCSYGDHLHVLSYYCSNHIILEMFTNQIEGLKVLHGIMNKCDTAGMKLLRVLKILLEQFVGGFKGGTTISLPMLLTKILNLLLLVDALYKYTAQRNEEDAECFVAILSSNWHEVTTGWRYICKKITRYALGESNGVQLKFHFRTDFRTLVSHIEVIVFELPLNLQSSGYAPFEFRLRDLYGAGTMPPWKLLSSFRRLFTSPKACSHCLGLVLIVDWIRGKISICQFLLFSLPRPPDVINFQEKVSIQFKGKIVAILSHRP